MPNQPMAAGEPQHRADARTVILPISAERALEIRHPVLRPGRPLREAVFSCDGDPTARHLGAFEASGRLVGVVTVHPSPWTDSFESREAWQLRGMATLPDVRGCGYGKALVREVERLVWEAGAELLWCNARLAALGFYEKLGWKSVGEEFDIPGVGPHFRMQRELEKNLAAGQRR